MNVIDWTQLQPTARDLKRAAQTLQGVAPLRALLKALVQAVLGAYPWEERADLVPLFDPARNYEPSDRIAFPQRDADDLRPDTWRIAEVCTVEPAENPVQGSFQVVTVQLAGRDRSYAAAISQAEPLALTFPLEDEEDLEWLVDNIVKTYGGELKSVVRQAVADGRLDVELHGDQVLPADALQALDETAQALLRTVLTASSLPITTGDLLNRLREAGHLTDLPDDEIAIVAVERFLDASPDYCSLGGGRWIAQERLAAIDRSVARRPRVPVIPSTVAAEQGQEEDTLWTEYEQVELEPEAQQALEQLGEEEVVQPEPVSLEEWRRTAPSGPLALRTLTYQQILEGFFPLGQSLASAFFLDTDPLWVDIQVITGEPLSFLVSRTERLIKAVDQEQFRSRFLDAGIPAGTRLWLERQGDFSYRVAPRPLPRPRAVRCKQAWMEEGKLCFQEAEIEMRYEGDPHLFKAELRFEDVEALFAEAEKLGWSIADCLWHIFPELGPAGESVHYTDLFNAVFFRRRMCSPQSVIAELYNRPCFVAQGDGCFRFEPEQGIHRKPARQPGRVVPITSMQESTSPRQEDQTVTTRDSDEATPREYFVFQQGLHSAYADQTGVVYNWRQGIPGSKQIVVGARFIYYRPVAKVFFGMGRVASITEYVDDNGRIDYNGHIADYESWEPPLAFTTELASQLSFAHPGRRSIGPAGIRKISEEDFDAILWAQRRAELWAHVQTLAGRELQTLDSRSSSRVLEVTPTIVRIRVAGTGQQRTIDYWRIEDSWRQLLEQRELTRSEIEERHSPRNSAYTAAILSGMPGVEYEVRPIRLRYRAASPPAAPAEPPPERTPNGQLIMPGVVPPGPLFEDPSVEETKPLSETTEPALIEPVPSGSSSSPPTPPPAGRPKKPAAPPPKRGEMQTKALFSQHYLDTRLPACPEWAEDPRLILETVRGLWQKARQHGDSWNEAQTEREFVQPVLQALGWSFIVQPKATHQGRVNRPDYALFADQSTKEEAYSFQGRDDPFYGRALAIAEAKYWGRPLSQKDASGRQTWKTAGNPSHQMVSYLVGTRAPWGILTNGLTWRLYSREVSSTASEFYEVDLGAILDFILPGAEPTDEQLEQFRSWWLFFRRDSFLPDDQGKSFVQRVHEGSATYAREISDKLKELVFDQVMPEIAGGFVAYRYHERGIREETEESLRQIYQASLSLLYKMLFILYAEARGLLPIKNTGYQGQSLTATAQWAAQQVDGARPLSTATHATPRYDTLLGLFHRIDRGDPSLGIPRYNGGLFNRSGEENRFLEEHRLSDRAVAVAVDTLVRDAGQPVDYAYISVRNLGAIYEGLLENRLRVVDAASGQIELVNDKGERKASGSYYTPDYIVEYIVRHTLDPLLEERDVQFRAAMDRCADRQRRLQRKVSLPLERHLMAELADAEIDARETFLGIKVLDPAMGSGHFLVNAVDHLTDGIIERMQAYHDEHPDVSWEWNPIQRLVERVRGEIVAEMAGQGIAVEAGRLDDTALLTRLVMKRCIYGVDLNRMAVELAKLSLWLHSFTVGAPLSFLDHHLRWGNSLIGIWDIENYIVPGSQRWDDVLRTLAAMVRVSQLTDSTVGEVASSSELYAQAQNTIRPTRERLNVQLAVQFADLGDIRRATEVAYLPLDQRSGYDQITRDKFERAQAIADEKRFFHWKIEFPEAFVDLERAAWMQNPGFDAVIGNPPYWNAWAMTKDAPVDRKAIFDAFRDSALLEGHWDLYIAFVVRALELCCAGGRHSFILPNPVLREKYATALRYHWLKNHTLERILTFGEANVFDAVSRQCVIYVILRDVTAPDARTTIDQLFEESAHGYTDAFAVPQNTWLNSHNYQIRIDPEYMQGIPIVAKIGAQSMRLGELLYVNVGATVSSKDSGAFDKRTVVTAFPQGNSKLFFDGSCVSRWEIAWTGEYLDYRQNEMSGPRVPELFEAEKLVVRIRTGEGERLLAAHDDAGMYCDHTVIVCCNYEAIIGSGAREDFSGYEHSRVPFSLGYILCFLNSQVLTYYFRHEFATGALQGSYSDVWPQSVRAFPIRRIAFVTLAGERAGLGEEGQRLVRELTSPHPRSPAADRRGAVEAWLSARLAPIHTPDPNLVRQHNADPRHANWQLPEDGPVEQADVVHDLLAHLAEEMIALNREKQAEIKGFLAWLEREGGTAIDSLTGKSRLQNYLGDYQKGEPHLALEDVLEILRKNRRRLKTDPSDRGFQEGLKKEYADSLGKLLPLKARLAVTDRLIDLIVYRLYGLAEEEIAIVEGQSGATGNGQQE